MKERLNARGQSGFTLIELLVVIAILGILAGVVVFAVGNSTDNAETASCITERASLVTAIAAADSANKVNGPNDKEDYTNYLSSSLQYFSVSGGLTVVQGTPDTLTSGTPAVARTNTAKVPAADCATLTATEIKFSL